MREILSLMELADLPHNGSLGGMAGQGKLQLLTNDFKLFPVTSPEGKNVFELSQAGGMSKGCPQQGVLPWSLGKL